MKSWSEISNKEQLAWLKSGKANGCGAKGGFVKPPYAIFFDASCNIHDWGYEYGVDEKDRLQADKGLLKYMKKDTKKLKPYTRRLYYYIWCYLYYFALRLFGKKAFYANKKT